MLHLTSLTRLDLLRRHSVLCSGSAPHLLRVDPLSAIGMPAHETHTSAAESGDAVASSSSSGAQQVDAVLGQTINGATASNGAVAGAEKRTFQVAEAGGMEDEDEGEGDDNETEVEGDEDEEEEDDDEDDELSDAPEKKQDATAGKVGKVEEDEDKDELEPEGEEHESIDYTTLWLKEKLRFDLAINVRLFPLRSMFTVLTDLHLSIVCREKPNARRSSTAPSARSASYKKRSTLSSTPLPSGALHATTWLHSAMA